MMTTTDDIEATVSEQLEQLREEGKLEVRPSQRCRICRDEGVRRLVNTLLGYGLNNRDVLSVLAPVNEGRSQKELITKGVLWRHIHNHFDVSAPARMIYREILRRRAEEDGRDFEQAIGNQVTTLAFLETVMVKGYSTLTQETTHVTVDQGMSAAIRLYDMTRQDAGVAEMADIMARQNRIISVIRDTVPEKYHSEILARIEDRELPQRPLDVETEEEEFDPLAADHDEDDDET